MPRPGTGTRDAPMAGRAVLVTGATSGIGRATALGLAAMGARVGIVGRDRVRAERVAAQIDAAGHPVEVFVADLSSQAEVRRLGEEVLRTWPRLDVLVNNAGGYWSARHVTADGLERTLAVNHLAPFLLTHLLLDRLRRSGSGRVVTVASNAHAQGRIDFDDLQGEAAYSGGRAYSQAKLATILFTHELARRLGPGGVTANAVHPGLVRTAFGAEDPAAAQRLLVPFLRPFMRSPTAGAVASIRAASSPELAGRTGLYLTRGGPRRSAPRSYDDAVAARLWEVSAALVGQGAGP